MSIELAIKSWIREIVREEVATLNGQVKRLTPEEVAERWQTDPANVRALAKAGRLKAIVLSERKMVFSIEEVLRFEDEGGVSGLKAVA